LFISYLISGILADAQVLQMTTIPISNELGSHETYMREALAEAEVAAREGEVPVGAILVGPAGDVVARGHNRPIGLNDPTAHAEVLVLRQAAVQLVNYRLPNHVIYVTLEPCVMCVGAMVQARLAVVVYGAADPKAGAIESVYQIGSDGRLNHRLKVTGGVLGEECKAVLQAFFRSKR
jgi:tRNA(adenine34) deaminase